MKSLALFFISFFMVLSVQAKGSSKTKKANSPNSNLTTEANFNGSTVNGKYFHSPEAVVAVEQEKKLISVVKPRKTFLYQIKTTQEDYK